MNDPISSCKICIKSLCLNSINLANINDEHFLNVGDFDCLLLVTRGTLRIFKGSDCELVSAPHIFILEKDNDYRLIAEEDYTECYEISALRNIEGDVIPSEMLTKDDYPFDTHRPFIK